MIFANKRFMEHSYHHATNDITCHFSFSLRSSEWLLYKKTELFSDRFLMIKTKTWSHSKS